MANLFPEIKLKVFLDNALSYLQTDYVANTATPTKSFLYRITNGNVVDRYDFYEQSKAIFIKTNDDPRKLKTRLFFDRERAAIPTIHITLPNESPKSDGLGFDSGFNEPIFDDTAETFTTVYNRNFQTTYNIIVSSDNTFEVILIYNVLRALLIGLIDTLNNNGYQNIKISGNDLSINPDIVPPNIFMRNVAVSFEYDYAVPMFNVNEMLNDINFTGTVINE